MKQSSYTYGGITCLRACKMCFEIKDESGQHFVVFRDPGSYYGAILVENRDELNVPDEKRQSLKQAVEHISKETNSASYGAYELRVWGSQYANGDPEFIAAALKDMKAAKNPAYVGNYCVALLCEIAKLPKVKTLPYLKELIPYLDKTTSLAGEHLDDYLKTIEKFYPMPEEVRRPFYFALASSNVAFYRVSYLTEAIENELVKAINSKEEDLGGLLRRFPVIKSSGPNADFVYEKYHGIGMKPNFFILYMIKNGKVETLYDTLIKNPEYIKDSLEDKEGFSPMEVFRYLASHGYEGKKKEIAKALMKVTKNPKAYFFLRPFLSEDEVIEIFKNKPKENGRWGDASRMLPCLLDTKKVKDALKEEYVGYYYPERYVLPSCAYRYEDWDLKKLEDYEIKNVRTGVRNSLNDGDNGAAYFADAIGLAAYGDKTISRYFLSEFQDSYGDDPYFCLVKAYVGAMGKKVKEMYAYPEGK